jgi:hypothetical protein
VEQPASSEELASMVGQSKQGLHSLLSLVAQYHGKASSIVGWEHKGVLLLQGTSEDGSHGLPVQKAAVMALGCRLLLLMGVCSDELSSGKLRGGSLMW